MEHCSAWVDYQGSRLPSNHTSSPEPDFVCLLLKFSLIHAVYCKHLGCDFTERSDKAMVLCQYLLPFLVSACVLRKTKPHEATYTLAKVWAFSDGQSK